MLSRYGDVMNQPTDLRKVADRVPGTVLAICLTVVAVTVIGSFVFLAATGADTTEFRSFVNTALNIGAVMLAGTGAVAAGVAAKSAGTAVQQTNGALDARMEKVLQRALATHLDTTVAKGKTK
jgi:hypothetical protein